MSTSLLYHGWGLRGYSHHRISYTDGTIVLHARANRSTLACPACGGGGFTLAGVVTRRFHCLPIGGKQVFLELPVQRLWAHDRAKRRTRDLIDCDYQELVSLMDGLLGLAEHQNIPVDP